MSNDRSPINGEYPTLTAEHADGWHDAEPHARCPECRRDRVRTISPRGESTWPGWRLSHPGVRVRNTHTGWEGTVTRVVTNRSAGAGAGIGYVRVRWDKSGAVGIVVSPAFDLEVI